MTWGETIRTLRCLPAGSECLYGRQIVVFASDGSAFAAIKPLLAYLVHGYLQGRFHAHRDMVSWWESERVCFAHGTQRKVEIVPGRASEVTEKRCDNFVARLRALKPQPAEAIVNWKKQLFARKDLELLLAEAAGEHRLHRVLGPVALTSLGVGCIIGAGIFVMTGRAAAYDAGPAVVISYAIAALGCAFAALCYAEFAAMAPVAGSAYTYAYTTLGEIFAWIIGWDLILEYSMGWPRWPRPGPDISTSCSPPWGCRRFPPASATTPGRPRTESPASSTCRRCFSSPR